MKCKISKSKNYLYNSKDDNNGLYGNRCIGKMSL